MSRRQGKRRTQLQDYLKETTECKTEYGMNDEYIKMFVFATVSVRLHVSLLKRSEGP